MNNQNSPSLEEHQKAVHTGFSIDPTYILKLILSNWYYFFIAILLAFVGARLYIGHTLPVYMVSTLVLVDDQGEVSGIGNDQFLQGMGLSGGMTNLENQIMILKSRDVTERAISELPFEIDYYKKTVNNSISIYPELPIRIAYDSENKLPRGIEFMFKYIGDNRFILSCDSENFPLSIQGSFGETIEIMSIRFRIESRNPEWLNSNTNSELFFVINSPTRLVNNYNSRLKVDLESRGGSILRIGISGTNRAKDVDFLNKVTEVFKNISLDKKNSEADRRIQFIEDQLVGITDSLTTTENRLQQFRSSNRVMDVSSQGEAILSQSTFLENERDRLKLEADYYDYLADYLAKDESKEVPMVPISMGISDPGLTRLVTELADLQGQLLNKGAGDLNPLQNLIEQRVQSTKESLLETINGLRRANSLAQSENQDRITRVNRQASELPATERQLLGIQRKFKLNDELYTFLLETRADLQMQKASNVSDSEVIDPADVKFSSIVSPNPTRIYFFALIIGSALPFLIILLFNIFNKKIKEDEISGLTDLPIVGNIPHNSEKTNTVVFDFPNSGISETYRLLRSRMQFFTKETLAPVILITSSMPEDGKTFCAINLASAYSLLGKKTILVGFDLRKPRIYEDFNLSNEKGISTWLIGKDKLEDIVQETEFENLSIISGGPVPPNPSELIALEKTGELFNILRTKFDYIIIDSSPVGFISDTFHLASLADSCLMVLRSRKTRRDMFFESLEEMRKNGVKSISLIINDIKSDKKAYAYADKSGYINYDDNKERAALKKPKQEKLK